MVPPRIELESHPSQNMIPPGFEPGISSKSGKRHASRPRDRLF